MKKTLLFIISLLTCLTTFSQTDQQRTEAADYITKFLNHRDNLTINEGYLKYYSFDKTIEYYSNTRGINPITNKTHFEITVKQTIDLSVIESIEFEPLFLDENVITLITDVFMSQESFREIKSFKIGELPDTQKTYSKVFNFSNNKPMSDEETKKFALATKILFSNQR